jgi:hypothetical protein
MPCGFQPAGHWGFPRHRVATSAHSLVCLAQKPFLLFPSVSFCYGREFLSTALPTSMTPPPDPALAVTVPRLVRRTRPGERNEAHWAKEEEKRQAKSRRDYEESLLRR